MHRDSSAGESFERSRQELVRNIAMHQDSLGRIAHTDALRLGIQQNSHRHLHIRILVDVDMAVADAGLDDRHRGVVDNVADQGLATARDEYVHQAARLHEVVDRFVRLPRDQLDGVGRYADLPERLTHHFDECGIALACRTRPTQ